MREHCVSLWEEKARAAEAAQRARQRIAALFFKETTMVRTLLIVGVGLATVAVNTADGQGKRVLTFNAELIKIEKANDEVKKVWVTATTKDLGIDNAELLITPKTKFFFVDDKGSRELSAKSALTDAAAKDHLQASKLVRVTGAGGVVHELRFGPAAVPKK